MRIVLIGQSEFGKAVFESLLEDGHHVVGVYGRPPHDGFDQEPLKDAARTAGIPVFEPEDYDDSRTLREFRALGPDLAVLAFVTKIIPAQYFSVPTHETICYHPSLLPRHRGASAINWSLIMGDKLTGVTVFWPDSGIDTGPILLQRKVEITHDDTVGSLYFEKLFPIGVEAVLESVRLIQDGLAPKIPQSEEDATYEPPCDDNIAGIDWDVPAQDVYNLIRGCDPRPGAFTHCKGDKIRFYDPKLIMTSQDEAPGVITRITSNRIGIAVSGGRIDIGRVRISDEKKISAYEFADLYELKEGAPLSG